MNTNKNNLLSSKNHKAYQMPHPHKRTECLKVLTFSPSDKQAIWLYQNQFERIRQWLKLRYSGKSLLVTIPRIDITLHQQQKKTQIRVSTDLYSELPLDAFYSRLQQSRSRTQVRNTAQIYIHHFIQLFQVVQRGGPLMNFFYSTNNVLTNQSPNSRISELFTKYSLNFTSTVGLELLYLSRDILREDLVEIFPLLPKNLTKLSSFNTQKESELYLLQVNRITSMKGFIWNIFCWVTKTTHNILIVFDQLKNKVSFQEVQQLLKKQSIEKEMNSLLKSYSQQIEKVYKVTGIELQKIFERVLLQNCQGVTWEEIYRIFFLKNNITLKNIENYIEPKKPISFTGDIQPEDMDPSFRISDKIIERLWNRQNDMVKNFYIKRFITPSPVYLMIRINRNFKSMMSHFNVFEFINKSNFSEQLLKVHLDFIEASIEQIENQKKTVIEPVEEISVQPPPPLQSEHQRQAYSRISSTQSLMGSLSLNIELDQQNPPIYVIHYMAETISDLSSTMFYQY